MNTVLLSQMAQLFIMIGLGYVLYKMKYMNAEFNGKLTRLLLDVTLPLLIIASVMNTDVEIPTEKIGMVFLVSFLMFAGLSVLSVVLIKIAHFPKHQQGAYMFMHTFANTAFMGFPIINALLGSEAMIYTAIFNIFFNLFAYTTGIMMMNYDGKMEGGFKSVLKLIDPKELISTGSIGTLVAIGIYFIPVTFPEIIYGVCHSVGNLTSPLAMMLIGSTLAKMPVKKIFSDWKVYAFTALKQFIVPVMLWPILCATVSDELIKNVMFILCIMPVANTSVLFANRYEKDEELAAKTVCLTTLFSLISTPLWLTIFKVG